MSFPYIDEAICETIHNRWPSVQPQGTYEWVALTNLEPEDKYVSAIMVFSTTESAYAGRYFAVPVHIWELGNMSYFPEDVYEITPVKVTVTSWKALEPGPTSNRN